MRFCFPLSTNQPLPAAKGNRLPVPYTSNFFTAYLSNWESFIDRYYFQSIFSSIALHPFPRSIVIESKRVEESIENNRRIDKNRIKQIEFQNHLVVIIPELIAYLLLTLLPTAYHCLTSLLHSVCPWYRADPRIHSIRLIPNTRSTLLYCHFNTIVPIHRNTIRYYTRL